MHRIAAVALSLTMVVLSGYGIAEAGSTDSASINGVLARADGRMSEITGGAVDNIASADSIDKVEEILNDALADLEKEANKANSDLDRIATEDPLLEPEVAVAKKTVEALHIAYASVVREAAEAWTPPPTTTTTLPPATTTTTSTTTSTTTTTTTPPSTQPPVTTPTWPPTPTLPPPIATTTTTTTTTVPPTTSTTTTPPPTTSSTTTTTIATQTAAPPVQPPTTGSPPAAGSSLLDAEPQPRPFDSGATSAGSEDQITNLIGRSLSVVLPPRIVFAVLSPFAIIEAVLRALLASGREFLIPVMLLAAVLGWVGGGTSKLGGALRRLLSLRRRPNPA